MKRMKRFTCILIAAVLMFTASAPALASSDDVGNGTVKTMQFLNSKGYAVINGIDISRYESDSVNYYEATAPVFVDYHDTEDLQYHAVLYYRDATYHVGDDGGVEISTYAWFEMDINNRAILTIPGLYNVRAKSQDGQFTESYIYVTAKAFPATPTSSTVQVNGKAVSFDGYNIKENNYIKIRDIAKLLNGTAKQFDVEWDDGFKIINIKTNKPYAPIGNELASGGSLIKDATPSPVDCVKVDSKYMLMTIYNIDGFNYFKLREIAAEMNFGVTWSEESNTVSIDTAASYSE